MNKVTINGIEYQIDIEKNKEQGLLKEVLNPPDSWVNYYLHYEDNFVTKVNNGVWIPSHDKEETKAFKAFGKIIQLRDWWWDNMCDGWKPNWKEDEEKYFIDIWGNKINTGEALMVQRTLVFPSKRIRNLFLETYRQLIEEAKMFL